MAGRRTGYKPLSEPKFTDIYVYIYIYFVLLTWTKSRNVGGSWRHSCDVNVMPCYSNQETWICISGIILGICSANCYAHTQNEPWYLHVIIPRQRNIACYWDVFLLRWRHNGRYSVSNHQSHDCLLNRLRRSEKTSKLRVTGLCAGNSPGTGEFPSQMASNAENVSIWWRHHLQITLPFHVYNNIVADVMAIPYTMVSAGIIISHLAVT